MKMYLFCKKCKHFIAGKLIEGMSIATWYENTAKAFKWKKTKTGYLCENCAQKKRIWSSIKMKLMNAFARCLRTKKGGTENDRIG